jgi:hypothetical protein
MRPKHTRRSEDGEGERGPCGSARAADTMFHRFGRPTRSAVGVPVEVAGEVPDAAGCIADVCERSGKLDVERSLFVEQRL